MKIQQSIKRKISVDDYREIAEKMGYRSPKEQEFCIDQIKQITESIDQWAERPFHDLRNSKRHFLISLVSAACIDSRELAEFFGNAEDRGLHCH